MTPELSKALKFFDQHTTVGDDVVPKGFFSAREIAGAKGSSRDQYTKFLLDRLVSNGKAEKQIFKVGRCRTTYYKVKE